jgi:DNA-binding transcriptional LysR family regulator
MEQTMRTIVIGLLSVELVVVFAGPSDAASKKYRRSYDYAQSYPSATPRQLRNAWAYNHAGHYYETDPNAFPVGSAGWWEMKRLEGGGRRVAVTVPDFASAARLVASGRLIVAMPARIAAHYTEHYSLKFLELPIELPKLHIAIAMHARSTSDSAVGWLIDQIKAELRPGSRKPTS